MNFEVREDTAGYFVVCGSQYLTTDGRVSGWKSSQALNMTFDEYSKHYYWETMQEANAAIMQYSLSQPYDFVEQAFGD